MRRHGRPIPGQDEPHFQWLRWSPLPVAVLLALVGWSIFGGLDSATGSGEDGTYEAGGVLVTIGQTERIAHHTAEEAGPPPSDDDPGEVVVVEGTTAEVGVLDNSFDAASIQIATGATVVWRNQGQTAHDVIPLEDNATWGVIDANFGPGEAYEHTFEQAGTYRYYCSLHPGMTGTIVVEDPEGFAMPQSMMPGMQAEDADRVHVEVVLRNSSDTTVSNRPDDFRLVSPERERWDLNEDVTMPSTLAPGFAVELDLYFDVAQGQEDLSLEWSQGGDVVEIPVGLGEAHEHDDDQEDGEPEHDHDDHDHDDHDHD
jgi:plastocyanin